LASHIREEGRLGVFSKKGWGDCLDLRSKVVGGGKNCIMRSFIICNLHTILLRLPNEG
jgi:hypothetical protein